MVQGKGLLNLGFGRSLVGSNPTASANMATWLSPHLSKVYEALTAIADNRIEMTKNNETKVASSSRANITPLSTIL